MDRGIGSIGRFASKRTDQISAIKLWIGLEVLGLAISAAVFFELYRHVSNPEFHFKHPLHVRQDAILIRVGPNDRVRRERELA